MSFRLWKQKVENPVGQEQTQQLAGSMSTGKTNDGIKSGLINLQERLSETAYSGDRKA